MKYKHSQRARCSFAVKEARGKISVCYQRLAHSGWVWGGGEDLDFPRSPANLLLNITGHRLLLTPRPVHIQSLAGPPLTVEWAGTQKQQPPAQSRLDSF